MKGGQGERRSVTSFFMGLKCAWKAQLPGASLLIGFLSLDVEEGLSALLRLKGYSKFDTKIEGHVKQ